MYRIDERQRCIQSARSLASLITESRSVPTASVSTLMLWLFDVGYTAIVRSSEDMLINLDATQLLCMPMYCSDTCGDLIKRVGRVNMSCFIQYMTNTIPNAILNIQYTILNSSHEIYIKEHHKRGKNVSYLRIQTNTKYAI